MADQVRATVAECSSSSRDDVMGELYYALTAAGHKVIVCRAPGSGQPGHLCFTHTYMALQKGACRPTCQHSTLSLSTPSMQLLTSMVTRPLRREH